MQISKKLIGGSLGFVGTLAITTAPAFAASTFTNDLWKFASGNAASIVDFNKNASGIWADGNFHVASGTGQIILDNPGQVTVTHNLGVVGKTTLSGNVTTNSNFTAAGTGTFGGQVVSGGGFGTAVTRATGATGSFQSVGADLTYEGAAGGTSTYHAGVMGNFMGDDLSNTTSSYHAGVIGSYNVTTADDSTGAKAGVVGEVGDMSVADAAVMAVLGGDGGAMTPNAAYGVQYFNSTAGSHFNYGLDLFHAATADYTSASAVEYGVADIRLASGATIGSGTTGNRPATCVKGSLYLNITTGIPDACTATDTWTAMDLTD